VIAGAGHAPMVQFPDRFNSVVIDELDGRQFAAQYYALRTGDIQGERVGKCDGQRGQEFTGDYTRLIISHCRDVTITNARIGYLQVAHSTVRVVNTHVRDGVDAKNTRLEMTASMVSGSLILDTSNVDAAGTTFVQAPAIATNEGAEPVVLRFSISTVSRAGNAPLALHDIVYLAPNETLIR